MPLVSVILPAYNHENFVGEAIESVLNQTFVDFELLIADDCSNDRTADVIRKYNDSRIKTYFFNVNRGAAENHRFLIENATGKYIALINSDDVWLSNRLKEQVEFMESHDDYGACFSWASFIDENNNEIMKDNKIFMQPNRTQGQWLAHFFLNGNCICHPSMLIKKEVYENIGVYNPFMRQLPDFDMWVRVVKKYNINIIQKVLVLHRRFIDGGGENTSAPIVSNSIRDVMESYYILNHFFDEISDDIFIEGFQKYFRKKDAASKDELICEKFFLLLDGKYYMPKINKMASIMFLISNSSKNVKDTLKKVYKYDEKNFFFLSSQVDLIGIMPKDNQYSDSLEFDIVGYIKNNRIKCMAMAMFNENSKLYWILKKIYIILRKKIRRGKL